MDIHAGLATRAEMKTSHASFRIDLLDRLVFMVRRLERPPFLFQSDTEPIGPREEVISAEDRLIDELQEVGGRQTGMPEKFLIENP